MSEKRKYEVDPVTGSAIHPYTWDGIGELETPPPRWWVLTYAVCVVFAIGWWIAFPAWPYISGYTTGLLGYSTRAEVAEELAAAKAAQAPYNDKLATLSYAEIAADPELSTFAMAGGKALFGENCAQCHGSGANGNVGYPNLLDDDWLWGGDYETLQTTIEHGVRSTNDDETRQAMMPAFGKDGILTREQVDDTVAYVLSLSGTAPADPAAAERGAQVYADNCAACHGDAGVGLHEMGGPRLNDAIWLFNGDAASISNQIWNPRHGTMPAWAGRLDPLAIKKLVFYVHSLGGGE